MSAKILRTTNTYTPVTIELTFDTLKQLEFFFSVYANPYSTAMKLCNNQVNELADVIDDTIDSETLEHLGKIIDQYK